MKNKLQNVTLLVIVIMFISCATSTLKVTVSPNKISKMDTVALISTYLDFEQPTFPLIQASAINEKTNSIASEIKMNFAKNINILRDSMAKILEHNLKCVVLYGDSLHKMDSYKKAKVTYDRDYSLVTNKKHFPEIVTAKDDFNPFEFSKSNVVSYFKDPNNYNSTITGLCQYFKTNYIAITYTQLTTVPGQNFSPGFLQSSTTIYIFNKNGERIGTGTNYYRPMNFKADEIDGYDDAIKTQPAIIRPIVKLISDQLLIAN